MRGNNSERERRRWRRSQSELLSETATTAKKRRQSQRGAADSRGVEELWWRVTRPQRRQPKLTNRATDFETSQLAAINCWAAWEAGEEAVQRKGERGGKWAGQWSRCAAPKRSSISLSSSQSYPLSPSFAVYLFVCWLCLAPFCLFLMLMNVATVVVAVVIVVLLRLLLLLLVTFFGCCF